MATVEEYVQDHHQRIGGIEEVLNSLRGKVSKLKEEMPEDLPWYFAKTPRQMQEELEKQGVFTKEQPGLQDDFDNAFRMFTQVNERGELIQGLTGARGPASLIELYQTMDLRGLLWNYGIGWVSALKGGYNVGTDAGKKKAEGTIKEIRERVLVEPAAIAEGLGSSVEKYMNSAKDMEFYIENRDLIKNLNRAKLASEYISLTNPPKPKKQEAVFYGYKRNKKGNIILDKKGMPKMEPVGKIESTSPLDTYNWPLGYGHKSGTTLFPATNGQNLDQIIQYLFKSKK